MNQPTQKWQRRKEDRPGEILEAALSVFVNQGYIAAKLDDIAARAGISKGTLYLYFDSKEAIFRAMVQEMIVPEVVKAEEAVKHHSGTRSDLIRSLVQNWWLVVGRTRLANIPKLMVSEANHFPELARFYIKNVVKRARDILSKVIEDGIKSGEFIEIDINSAVRLLMAPLVFAVIWEKSLAPYDSETYDVDLYVETHIKLFLSGIQK